MHGALDAHNVLVQDYSVSIQWRLQKIIVNHFSIVSTLILEVVFPHQHARRKTSCMTCGKTITYNKVDTAVIYYFL